MFGLSAEDEATLHSKIAWAILLQSPLVFLILHCVVPGIDIRSAVLYKFAMRDMSVELRSIAKLAHIISSILLSQHRGERRSATLLVRCSLPEYRGFSLKAPTFSGLAFAG